MAELVRLSIEDGEPAAAGVRRVALLVLDDAMLRLAEPGPPSLHEARKRFKELRALIRLVERSLPEGEGRSRRTFFRDAGRMLAGWRDADALVESFDALREHFAGDWGPRQYRKIRAALEGRRSTAPPLGENVLTGLQRQRQEIAAWDFGEADFSLISRGLRRGYLAGARGMRRAGRERTALAIHEWRKRVKDHWYQVRFIEGVWPEAMKARASSLHALSRALGRHHDLVLLRELLLAEEPRFGSHRYVARFRSFIDRRLGGLEREALLSGRRLFDEKADRWHDRVERYWKLWRALDR